MKIVFDISQPLINLSELELPPIPVSAGMSLLISEVQNERRQLLQRGLNLEDAAKSLLTYMKVNVNNLYKEKASISSLEELELENTDLTTKISDVDKLDNLRTGSFNINGVDFQVNIATDSLKDLIDRINTADAGVFASYSSIKKQFTISSLREKPLFLENGSSNFFEGLNLKDGYIVGEKGIEIKDLFDLEEWKQKFVRFAGRFNKFMEIDFELARAEDVSGKIIKLFQGAIQEHIDNNFIWGNTRISSNIEVSIDSSKIKFSKFKIGFAKSDEPYRLYNFLTASNGVLNSLVSLSGRQTQNLIGSLQPLNFGGLIVDQRV